VKLFFFFFSGFFFLWGGGLVILSLCLVIIFKEFINTFFFLYLIQGLGFGPVFKKKNVPHTNTGVLLNF